MKNFEKYKTAEERAKAFYKYCIEKDRTCKTCQKLECMKCEFEWLELEAEEEKPLPCPFCGGAIQIINDTQAILEKARWLVDCYCCPYEYGAETKDELVAAHNRVAKAVLDAKAKEVNDER